MLKVLLVDDLGGRTELALPLMERGHMATACVSVKDAWHRLDELDFDWVVCRRTMVGGLVDAFLEQLARRKKPLPCQLLVIDPPDELPLEEYPVIRTELLRSPWEVPVLSQLMETSPQDEYEDDEEEYLPRPAGVKIKSNVLAPGVQPLIGSSPAVARIIRQVERVAQADSTVLVLGESGTGKELVAQSIHFRSKRANKPLVPVNCGAIPAELLESELFGHTKGAFTGATANRPGKFAQADGGTLFLDEVGELPHALQVKLLRVLQDGEIIPLGSNKSQKVDVRIIAATNQDLEQLVEKKLFREDLYYRLNVIPVHMPPVRERGSDAAELISFFVALFNDKCGSKLEGFTSDALEALCAYPWPGNVRELKNFVERLAILSDAKVITLRDLPEKIQRCKVDLLRPINITLPEEGLNFYEAVDQFEKSLILQALDRTGWNKNKAAGLLTMNRTTLVEKIKKKELSRQPSAPGAGK